MSEDKALPGDEAYSVVIDLSAEVSSAEITPKSVAKTLLGTCGFISLDRPTEDEILSAQDDGDMVVIFFETYEDGQEYCYNLPVTIDKSRVLVYFCRKEYQKNVLNSLRHATPNQFYTEGIHTRICAP